MIHNLVGKCISYEEGTMSDEDMVSFFQELIDTGLCWQLQGSYGRQAAYLIEIGECIASNSKAEDMIEGDIE